MSDLALNPSGDLDLVAGSPHLLHGEDAILQDLRTRLRSFKGEWFLDTRLGLPYLDYVNGTPLAVIRAHLIKLAAATAGIGSVRDVRFSFDRQHRKLSVTIQAVLAGIDSGELVFTEAVVV